MTPSAKTWVFGRVPVITFVVMALAWIVFIAYSLATRPPYPTYPNIGAALALACYTIVGGLTAFLLAIFGIRSHVVSKRWAWSGLILNAPIALYFISYYPAVLIYQLFAKP